MSVTTIIVFVLAAAFVFSGLVSVRQGTVAVITMFGKYQRTLRPGLNFKVPFLEQVFRTVSLQNRSIELGFQATTMDQANVHFTSLLLFSVVNSSEESIKAVAFKFIDEKSFMQTLARVVEGSIRAFVATKRQSEVLSLRREITEQVKENIDHMLEEWGYHLIDLQINDITFDDEVMKSMAKVVASNNLKAAAENEGQALLITKTKSAEAEGNAIKIAAEAEREASRMRGQAVASFREEVARGMSSANKEMQEAHLDTSVMLFTMWMESIKQIAENGKGNVIFLDGSPDGMDKTMKNMMALDRMEYMKQFENDSK